MLLKILRGTEKLPVSKVQRLKNKAFWLLLPVVGIGSWLGYKVLQSYLVQPKAIVVLGGHENRERFAANLASQHPEIPIWVSSGSPENYAKRIFAKRGIKSDRLHLDYQAKDTVTNFTTLVASLKSQNIDSVYLITSDNHMRRALLIGEIVFGSQGIVIKPLSVPCNAPPESLEKSFRDSARAVFWVITGKTGETLINH